MARLKSWRPDHVETLTSGSVAPVSAASVRRPRDYSYGQADTSLVEAIKQSIVESGIPEPA